MVGTRHEKREPPSMLHEVVNYKVKGTRPRGRPITTWLKSIDNQLKEKGDRIKDVMSKNLYQDRSAWRTTDRNLEIGYISFTRR